MPFYIQAIVIFLALSLSAIFVAYEMALASITKAKLIVLANHKRRGATDALFMKERMEASLAVIQLCFTFLSTITALPPSGMIPLATGLAEALEQKDIQIYLTAPEAEQALANMGWAGRLLPTHAPEDYLLVVNSNIQGGKSDAAIS